MTSTKKVLLYGFFIWLIPFFVAFPLFTLRESNRIFFESIMPVVLTIVTVIFGVLYFKKVAVDLAKKAGVLVGLIWMAMSVLIDLPLFSFGPMKMSLGSYIQDIGFTYFIIPTIMIGMGCLMARSAGRVNH